MRFTINKEKFLKALNAASHGVAVKSPNPVLSNVKLERKRIRNNGIQRRVGNPRHYPLYGGRNGNHS